MNELQTFRFNNDEVRTVLINDEPYFVGKDVADILGYSNARDALAKHVDDEDRDTVAFRDGTSGNPNLSVINESGVYSLILGSKLPEAKKFKRWVTSEVLPAIRKTGRYQVPSDPMEALRLMFEAQTQSNEKIAIIDHRITNLEENAPLNPGEYNLVSKKVTQRIHEIKRERCMDLNKKQNSELYRALNKEIAMISGVYTRSQLRQKHLKEVLEFVRDWEPSKATLVLISQMALEV
ncbi:MAG: phage repressor protein [Erysipelotrichaceae bacterium]|nr:phage repressor protein [Erysipelotrichaceae bacterium]